MEEPLTTVYFATNRNPNRRTNPDGFGGSFNPESVDSLRFGKAEVSQVEGEYSVTRVEVAPERLREDRTKAQLGSANMFTELQERMRKGNDTLERASARQTAVEVQTLRAPTPAAEGRDHDDAGDRREQQHPRRARVRGLLRLPEQRRQVARHVVDAEADDDHQQERR